MKQFELNEALPVGLIATRKWLLGKGATASMLDNHVKSGRLKVLTKGVYERSELPVSEWQAMVISIDRMRVPVYVGGLSALELAGNAQYLQLGVQRTIQLYSDSACPRWMGGVLRSLPAIQFSWHKTSRIWNPNQAQFVQSKELVWRNEYEPFRAASLEQAILEVLHEVPEQTSFEHADQLMQGLVNLSPKRLDLLLLNCRSIKAKRLFFWFADQHQHSWRESLDALKYDLGSGKRVIQTGGRLVAKYGITVPKDMVGNE